MKTVTLWRDGAKIIVECGTPKEKALRKEGWGDKKAKETGTEKAPAQAAKPPVAKPETPKPGNDEPVKIEGEKKP